MKKIFNIKILIISVFAFICFFMINEKVEAIQCRYNSIGNSTFLNDGFEDKTENYQIELSNDSGSTKLSIYDKKNNRSIPVENSALRLDDFAGYTYKYIGNLSDIKLNDSCPTQLYYYSGYDVSNSITYKYYTLDISVNEFMNRYCYDSLERCGSLALSCTDCNKEKQGGGSGQSGTKCIYATYDDAKENKAKDNYFSINLNDLSIIEKIGDYENRNLSVEFSKKDLVNPDACPTILYLNRNSTQYAVSLYARGDESRRLGILKTSVVSHDKNQVIKINDACDKLEGTKTLEWVKKIYTLLRILVPTLIIILSVIDFLGIVLSGDSDKMEKAKNKFIKRIIIGILFVLIPVILELVLRMAGIIDTSLTEVVCKIMN